MMRQMLIFNCNTDFILGGTTYGCMLRWLVVVDLMSRTTDWKHPTGYILVRRVFTISQPTSSKRS